MPKKSVITTALLIIGSLFGVTYYSYLTIIHPNLPFSENIKTILSGSLEPTLLAPIAPKDAEDAAQKAKKAAKEEEAKAAKKKAKETADNTCLIFGGTINAKNGTCEYKSEASKEAAEKYVPYVAPRSVSTNESGDCIVGGNIVANGKKAIANKEEVCTCQNGGFTNCAPASATNAPDYLPNYLQNTITDGGANIKNQDLVKAIIEKDELAQKQQEEQTQKDKELQDLLNIINPNLQEYDNHDGLDSFFIAQKINSDKLTLVQQDQAYIKLKETCRASKASTTENTHVDIACSLPAIQALAIEESLPKLKSKLTEYNDANDTANINKIIQDLESQKTSLQNQVTQQLAYAKLKEATNIVNTEVPANENVAARQAERYAELRKSLITEQQKYSTVIELQDGTKAELGQLIETLVTNKEETIALQDAINYLKNPNVINRASMVQKSNIQDANSYAEKLIGDYDKSLLHEIKIQTDPEYLSGQLLSCQKICAGVCGINSKGYAECVIATQATKNTTKTPLIVQRATECKDPGSAVLQENGYLCINEYKEDVEASNQAANDQERAIALLINQAANKTGYQGTALKNIIDNNPPTNLSSSTSLTALEINSIITYNQLAQPGINNQTIYNAIDKYLCPPGDGLCLLTDQGKFTRQDISNLVTIDPEYQKTYQRLFGNATLQYTTAMCKDTNTSGPCQIMHDMGNLGQACRPQNAGSGWRIFGINNNICNYEHLECVNNTCQLKKAAEGALIIAHGNTTQQSQEVNQFNQNFAIDPASLQILKSKELNKQGCITNNSTYLSNGSCYICHDKTLKINSAAPDPSYCDPNKQATLLSTLPGHECANAGGFCTNLGNYTDATLAKLPYKCPGQNLSCFKHTAQSKLPTVGQNCNITGCGMGLECLKGVCVSPLVASFDEDYQNGVLASEMERTTISTIPILNTVLEFGKMIASSATRAITPSYYSSANHLADYTLELNKNLTSCKTCQSLIKTPINEIKKQNIASLNGNSLLSVHMRTLDEMEDRTTILGGEWSFDHAAYRFLGNTSRFTGAWTGNRTNIFAEETTTSGIGTLLQGSDNKYNQTFLNYAAKNAELNSQDASLLSRVPVAIPLFIEGAITTADFIDVGGVAHGISTATRKIGTSATAQASKLIARELTETTVKQSISHNLSRNFYQTVIKTTNIIPDLADNITRATSPIAVSILQNVDTVVAKPLSSRYTQFIQGAIQTSSSYIAKGAGSNTQAAKLFYQGAGNILQAIFTSPAKQLALKEAADSLISHQNGLLIALQDASLLEAAYQKSTAAGYKGTLADYSQKLLIEHASSAITSSKTAFGRTTRSLTVPNDASFLQALLLASNHKDPQELAKLLMSRAQELNIDPAELLDFIDEQTQLATILSYAERYGLATTTDPTSLARFAPLYQDALTRFTTGGPTTLESWLNRTIAENAGLDPDLIRRFGATLELTNSPFLTHNGQALTYDVMRQRLIVHGFSQEVASSLATQYSDAPIPFFARLTDYKGKGLTDIGYSSQEARRIVDLTKNKLIYVQDNKLVFATPLKPTSDETKLLAKLNSQMENLAKASGFTNGLNPDQATNYLGILDFMANNSSAKTRRLLINPSTGGGKNSVLTPLASLFEMEQGNNFLSAVTKGQLNDEIAKTKMLNSFFDQHKAYVVKSDESGIYRLFDLDGRELPLSDLDNMLRNQNVPAWQFWRSKFPSFQIITDHDSLGFLLTEALKYQKGLPTAQRQIASIMSTFFKSQPAGWIDELGMVGGHWMSSFGKSYTIEDLPSEFANGLSTGLEAIEIYEKSGDSKLLKAVETGEITPTFNRNTNTLNPLSDIRQLQLIGESLDYATQGLGEQAKAIIDIARTNIGEFDRLARTTTLEFQTLLTNKDLAEEITTAMARARNYRDAIQARLQILAMIPGDDFVKEGGLIRLAIDKRVTGQQYSNVMQALALQDIGANKLGANLADLTPLHDLTINPTSLTVSMDDVMDAFGAIYITDATTGIPRSKYGLKTLMADVNLRAPNAVRTATDLDGVTNNAAEVVLETFGRDEMALVIDAKVGSSTRQSLNSTTNAIVTKAETGLGDTDTLYVALLNGDGSNQLIKVERGVPIDYSQGTFFDTPEELYAEAARLHILKDGTTNNRILAISQNRTRGANFKPKASNPPPEVISQAIVVGNIDELTTDTVRQSAGRLRGYEQPPYTLILQSNIPLTTDESVSRILANSSELESNLSFSRRLEEITQFTTQDLISQLRSLAKGNNELLGDLDQFDHQLQTVGQNIHNTPRYIDPEEALYNEYLLSRNRLNTLLTNAANKGIPLNEVNKLREAYGLLDDALTTQDIADAIAGTRLAQEKANNLNEKVIALFNKSATQPLPERYAYGAPAATHLQQQTVQTVANTSPSRSLLPASANRDLQDALSTSLSKSPTLQVASQTITIDDLIREADFEALDFVLRDGSRITFVNSDGELYAIVNDQPPNPIANSDITNLLPTHPQQISQITLNNQPLQAASYQTPSSRAETALALPSMTSLARAQALASLGLPTEVRQAVAEHLATPIDTDTVELETANTTNALPQQTTPQVTISDSARSDIARLLTPQQPTDPAPPVPPDMPAEPTAQVEPAAPIAPVAPATPNPFVRISNGISAWWSNLWPTQKSSPLTPEIEAKARGYGLYIFHNDSPELFITQLAQLEKWFAEFQVDGTQYANKHSYFYDFQAGFYRLLIIEALAEQDITTRQNLLKDAQEFAQNLHPGWWTNLPDDAATQLYGTVISNQRGYFGKTFVNSTDNTLTKLFKDDNIQTNAGFNSVAYNQDQVGFYQKYGGKHPFITFKGRVPGGFQQEYFHNTETLKDYIDRGGRLTDEVVDELIKELKAVHQLTKQGHGDLMFNDNSLNYGNLLVQTMPDGKIRLIPIDFFGSDNNPSRVPISSPSYMQQELTVVERLLKNLGQTPIQSRSTSQDPAISTNTLIIESSSGQVLGSIPINQPLSISLEVKLAGLATFEQLSRLTSTFITPEDVQEFINQLISDNQNRLNNRTYQITISPQHGTLSDQIILRPQKGDRVKPSPDTPSDNVARGTWAEPAAPIAPVAPATPNPFIRIANGIRAWWSNTFSSQTKQPIVDPMYQTYANTIQDWITANQDIASRENLSLPTTNRQWQLFQDVLTLIKNCHNKCNANQSINFNERITRIFPGKHIGNINEHEQYIIALRSAQAQATVSPEQFQSIQNQIESSLAKLNTIIHRQYPEYEELTIDDVFPEFVGTKTMLGRTGGSYGAVTVNELDIIMDLTKLGNMSPEHAALHEAIHTIQSYVSQLRHEQRYNINAPTTYAEVFTEWLAFRLQGLDTENPPQANKSIYAGGVQLLDRFVRELSTAEQDYFEQIALTNDFDSLNRWFSDNADTSPAELLEGFSDHDYYLIAKDAISQTMAIRQTQAAADPAPTPSLLSRAATAVRNWWNNLPFNKAKESINTRDEDQILRLPDRFENLDYEPDQSVLSAGITEAGDKFSLRAFFASFSRNSSYNILTSLIQKYNRKEIDKSTFITSLMELSEDIVSTSQKRFYLNLLQLEQQPSEENVALSSMDDLNTLIGDNVTKDTIIKIKSIVGDIYFQDIREEVVRILLKEGIDLGGMLLSQSSQINYVNTIIERIHTQFISQEQNQALQQLYTRIYQSSKLKSYKDFQLNTLSQYLILIDDLNKDYNLDLPKETTLNNLHIFLTSDSFAQQLSALDLQKQSNAISSISSFITSIPTMASESQNPKDAQEQAIKEISFFERLEQNNPPIDSALSPLEKLVGKPEIRWIVNNGYLNLTEISLEGESLLTHLERGRTIVITSPDGEIAYYKKLADGRYQKSVGNNTNTTNLKQLEEKNLPTVKDLTNSQDYIITILEGETSYIGETNLFNLIADAPLRQDTRTTREKLRDNMLGRVANINPLAIIIESFTTISNRFGQIIDRIFEFDIKLSNFTNTDLPKNTKLQPLPTSTLDIGQVYYDPDDNRQKVILVIQKTEHSLINPNFSTTTDYLASHEIAVKNGGFLEIIPSPSVDTSSIINTDIWINGKPITRRIILKSGDIIETPSGFYTVTISEGTLDNNISLTMAPITTNLKSYKQMNIDEIIQIILSQITTYSPEEKTQLFSQLLELFIPTTHIEVEVNNSSTTISINNNPTEPLGKASGRRSAYSYMDDKVIKTEYSDQIPRELALWILNKEARKSLAEINGWGYTSVSKTARKSLYLIQERIDPLTLHALDSDLSILIDNIQELRNNGRQHEIPKLLSYYNIRKEDDIDKILSLLDYMKQSLALDDYRIDQIGYNQKGELVIFDWGIVHSTTIPEIDVVKEIIRTNYTTFSNKKSVKQSPTLSERGQFMPSMFDPREWVGFTRYLGNEIVNWLKGASTGAISIGSLPAAPRIDPNGLNLIFNAQQDQITQNITLIPANSRSLATQLSSDQISTNMINDWNKQLFNQYPNTTIYLTLPTNTDDASLLNSGWIISEQNKFAKTYTLSKPQPKTQQEQSMQTLFPDQASWIDHIKNRLENHPTIAASLTPTGLYSIGHAPNAEEAGHINKHIIDIEGLDRLQVTLVPEGAIEAGTATQIVKETYIVGRGISINAIPVNEKERHILKPNDLITINGQDVSVSFVYKETVEQNIKHKAKMYVGDTVLNERDINRNYRIPIIQNLVINRSTTKEVSKSLQVTNLDTSPTYDTVFELGPKMSGSLPHLQLDQPTLSHQLSYNKIDNIFTLQANGSAIHAQYWARVNGTKIEPGGINLKVGDVITLPHKDGSGSTSLTFQGTNQITMRDGRFITSPILTINETTTKLQSTITHTPSERGQFMPSMFDPREWVGFAKYLGQDTGIALDILQPIREEIIALFSPFSDWLRPDDKISDSLFQTHQKNNVH